MTPTGPVHFAVDGALAIITIARPEKRNAIDPETSTALGEAIGRLDTEPGVRVGILTGAGETFCAGADLAAIADGRLEEIIGGPGGFGGLVAARRRRPLVAALNGHALAGGLELALACDLVVADERAELGLPEVSRGIIAGAGGVFRLPRQIPAKPAMELVLTGSRIDAARAHELGLVNRVAPAGEALRVARELAARIAEHSPAAVAESRRLVEIAIEGDIDSLWQRNTEAWGRVLAGPDPEEGARAFVERRQPVWSDQPA